MTRSTIDTSIEPLFTTAPDDSYRFASALCDNTDWPASAENDAHEAFLTDPITFRRCVIERLCTGFATPNGSLAWTSLYSDISDVDADDVCREFDDLLPPYFSEHERWLHSRRTALSYLVKYASTALATRETMKRVLSQSIIRDCGRTESRSYTTLFDASMRLLFGPAFPVGDRSSALWISAMAYLKQCSLPSTIGRLWNEYIALQVHVNNQIQRHASRVRYHMLRFEHQFMTTMVPTDLEINAIAGTPQAVLFAYGRSQIPLEMPPSLCPAIKTIHCPV
jgi:hypothetical protein